MGLKLLGLHSLFSTPASLISPHLAFQLKTAVSKTPKRRIVSIFQSYVSAVASGHQICMDQSWFRFDPVTYPIFIKTGAFPYFQPPFLLDSIDKLKHGLISIWPVMQVCVDEISKSCHTETGMGASTRYWNFIFTAIFSFLYEICSEFSSFALELEIELFYLRPVFWWSKSPASAKALSISHSMWQLPLSDFAFMISFKTASLRLVIPNRHFGIPSELYSPSTGLETRFSRHISNRWGVSSQRLFLSLGPYSNHFILFRINWLKDVGESVCSFHSTAMHSIKEGWVLKA